VKHGDTIICGRQTASSDEAYLRRAIAACQRGIAAGQTPFGACVVRDGAVLAEAHNEVYARCDPSAHAEVQALRLACAAAGTIDLSGATMYATCEPCPMCFAACHWARVSRIVFGSSITDAAAAGFREMPISNKQMRELGGSNVEIVPGLLRDECNALFAEWAAAGRSEAY